MKHLLLCGLLLSAAAHAQVQKCTIDGKTVYSDSQCGQQGTRVNTTANSVDGAGLRKEAQRQREAEERANQASQITTLAANVPPECRFKHRKKNDDKGVALAKRAQDECIQNIANAAHGKPASLIAYGLWKDHRDQTASRTTICTTSGFQSGGFTSGTAICN